MSYKIGIDAGSKTIKVVVLDECDEIVYSVYTRHRAAVRETLIDICHRLSWVYGEIAGPIAVTGSAGMGISQIAGIPFIQEVVATTKAVNQKIPDADAIIELGGEDSKVIYLTGGFEQRMNSTCAGGTGGFIDTIAFMLGVHSTEINNLALQAMRTYPIASRCAVFAQTDVRPLLNQGAKKADIAASALDAVVRQTLGGLACGRPISGKVVFLGGPLQHIPELVKRFSNALHLAKGMAIKPEKAHLYTALGAALYAADHCAPIRSLSSLEKYLENCANPDDDLNHLPPLFSDDGELKAFRTRHDSEVVPRASLYEYAGPAYLGIDAGSTTVKLALIAETGELLYSDYKPVSGDSLKTTTLMLGNMYRRLPSHYSSKESFISIRHATATGYGEDLLQAALQVDSGVVETVAHTKAALFLDPQASFVLDIGGQDMKALWIKEGQVTDVVLNEICSSGCGSFIEGTSYSLKSYPEEFNRVALEAPNPLDLGTKCTVFMTSRVRHAQKIGAPLGDIAAGIAYSVVQNALYRIIGRDKVSSMGSHIVVQGGAFKSDAVLRAFEKIAGVEVFRPDAAHLMGAIGAALVARERAHTSKNKGGQSALLGQQACQDLTFKREIRVCTGCLNSCRLSVIDFGDQRAQISGNRCARAYEVCDYVSDMRQHNSAPNGVKALYAALQKYSSRHSDCSLVGGITIGLLNTLSQYEQLPFWHTFFSEMGFSVEVPDEGAAKFRMDAASTVPSESVCQPAKISHERALQLLSKGVQVIFAPRIRRMQSCTVFSQYSAVLQDPLAQMNTPAPLFVTPCFTGVDLEQICQNESDRNELLQVLLQVAATDAQRAILAARYEDALKRALSEQKTFELAIQHSTEKICAWVEQQPNRFGIVLAGRPYHFDAAILHDIDQVAADLGLAVILPLGLGLTQTANGETHQQNWPAQNRFSKLSQFVQNHSRFELVCLQSFGCSMDAVNIALIRDELAEHHKMFTALKLDDIVDVAHIRIRLRTLAESLQSAYEQSLKTVQVEPETQNAWDKMLMPALVGDSVLVARMRQVAQDAENGLQPAPGDRIARIMQRRDPETTQRIAPPQSVPLPPGFSQKSSSLVSIMESPLKSDDLETLRSSVPADMCSTAAFLTAHAIEYIKGHTRLAPLAVPAVCQNCLLGSLPVLVARATNKTVPVVWEEPRQLMRGAGNQQLSVKMPADKIRIGIMGNPLMCFDSLINEGVVDFLESLSCQVVFPRMDLISADEVTYYDQMEIFRQQQVDQVLYLQSLGCLKGHVQVRGALLKLNKIFPDIPITVIDYDVESSALNRQNRIRLVVEAAHAQRPLAPYPPALLPARYSWLGDRAAEVFDEAYALIEKDAVKSPGKVLPEDGAQALAWLIESGFLQTGDIQDTTQVQEILMAKQNEMVKEMRQLEYTRNLLDKSLSYLRGSSQSSGPNTHTGEMK